MINTLNCMDNVSEGIWIKNSKDISSWNTTVGPDIIIVEMNKVRMLFLHTDIIQEYDLDNNSLVFNNVKQGQQIVVKKNGILTYTGIGYDFSYFTLKKSFDFNILQHQDFIIGKWVIENGNNLNLIFDTIKDGNTNEKLMKYSSNNSEKEGRWSTFRFKELNLIELNMIESSERRLMIVESLNQTKMEFFYINSDGVKKELILNRIAD